MGKDTRRRGIMDIIRSPYARGFIAKYKWRYLIGMAILVVIDLAQTRVPLLVGNIIDRIEDHTIVEGDFTRTVAIMALIVTLVLLGRLGWRYCIFGAARHIEKDIRDDLFTHLLTLPTSYFHEHKAGEVMAFMTNDIEAIRMTFAVTLMMGLDCVVIGAATVYNMVTKIDPILSVVSILPLLMVGLVTRFVGREMHVRFTKRQEAFAVVSDFVQEKLSGIKVIKAFVQEEKECREFLKVNQASCDANIRQTRVEAFMFPFMRMITGVSIALTVAYGGTIAIQGRISVGDFGAFIQYLNMLVWPIASIGRIINVVTRGSASLSRIEDVLHTESDIKDIIPAEKEEPLKGSIEVKNLSFTYPGDTKPTLHDISFTVNQGETLGIVGRTGAGKTTLVSLLLRTMDPERDMIYVGGKEIHDVTLRTLRETMG